MKNNSINTCKSFVEAGLDGGNHLKITAKYKEKIIVDFTNTKKKEMKLNSFSFKTNEMTNIIIKEDEKSNLKFSSSYNNRKEYFKKKLDDCNLFEKNSKKFPSIGNLSLPFECIKKKKPIKEIESEDENKIKNEDFTFREKIKESTPSQSSPPSSLEDTLIFNDICLPLFIYEDKHGNYTFNKLNSCQTEVYNPLLCENKEIIAENTKKHKEFLEKHSKTVFTKHQKNLNLSIINEKEIEFEKTLN